MIRLKLPPPARRPAPSFWSCVMRGGLGPVPGPVKACKVLYFSRFFQHSLCKTLDLVEGYLLCITGTLYDTDLTRRCRTSRGWGVWVAPIRLGITSVRLLPNKDSGLAHPDVSTSLTDQSLCCTVTILRTIIQASDCSSRCTPSYRVHGNVNIPRPLVTTSTQGNGNR
jgi:hypothetical protein